MTTITTPARRLVEAFGDCDALEAMYCEDVTWRLNHSLAPNIAWCNDSVFSIPGSPMITASPAKGNPTECAFVRHASGESQYIGERSRV